jgi:hypothetical protein
MLQRSIFRFGFAYAQPGMIGRHASLTAQSGSVS